MISEAPCRTPSGTVSKLVLIRLLAERERVTVGKMARGGYQQDYSVRLRERKNTNQSEFS